MIREGCSRIVCEVVGDRLRTFSNRKGMKKVSCIGKRQEEENDGFDGGF